MILRVGETVWCRDVAADQSNGIVPTRVVAADDNGVLLWLAPGSRLWILDMPDGRGIFDAPLSEWARTRRVPVARSIEHGALFWRQPGLDWSARWFFRPDGTFYAWYANIERPAYAWRADDGTAWMDTVDWDLDVWVHPDRTYELKDEDVLISRLAETPYYWVTEPDRVRRAATNIIALVEAEAFPFDGTWCDFRQNPDWPALPVELPPHWDGPSPIGWPVPAVGESAAASRMHGGLAGTDPVLTDPATAAS